MMLRNDCSFCYRFTAQNSKSKLMFWKYDSGMLWPNSEIVTVALYFQIWLFINYPQRCRSLTLSHRRTQTLWWCTESTSEPNTRMAIVQTMNSEKYRAFISFAAYGIILQETATYYNRNMQDSGVVAAYAHRGYFQPLSSSLKYRGPSFPESRVQTSLFKNIVCLLVWSSIVGRLCSKMLSFICRD